MNIKIKLRLKKYNKKNKPHNYKKMLINNKTMKMINNKCNKRVNNKKMNSK